MNDVKNYVNQQKYVGIRQCEHDVFNLQERWCYARNHLENNSQETRQFHIITESAIYLINKNTSLHIMCF